MRRAAGHRRTWARMYPGPPSAPAVTVAAFPGHAGRAGAPRLAPRRSHAVRSAAPRDLLFGRGERGPDRRWAAVGEAGTSSPLAGPSGGAPAARAVRRDPRRLRDLPARQGDLARARALRRAGPELPLERVGPVRRRPPQQRVPPRRRGDGQVRADHRADRPRARRRSRRPRRQVRARHRGVPRDLLLDRRHVGRRRQPDVAVPARAERRRALQHRLGAPPVPGGQGARACCAIPAPRSAAVAASSVWASLGFTFILVTAGLQGIPRELHEAAVVDGAGGIRRFCQHHPAAARRRRCCSSRSC